MNDSNPFDLSQEPPNVPSGDDAFSATISRLKTVGTIGGIVGAVCGVCVILPHLLMSENPSWRGIVTFPIMCSFLLSGMVTGVTLLRAPPAFFKSDQGREYLKMIGARNVSTARIAIVIGLVLGCAFLGLVMAGVLQMLGIIAAPHYR